MVSTYNSGFAGKRAMAGKRKKKKKKRKKGKGY
jgi:hypothetical protein